MDRFHSREGGLGGEKSEEVEGWLRGEGLRCPEGQFRTCTAGVLCTPQLQRNDSCLLTAFTGRRGRRSRVGQSCDAKLPMRSGSSMARSFYVLKWGLSSMMQCSGSWEKLPLRQRQGPAGGAPAQARQRAEGPGSSGPRNEPPVQAGRHCRHHTHASGISTPTQSAGGTLNSIYEWGPVCGELPQIPKQLCMGLTLIVTAA